ncbi:MAG: hypothetical protein NT154_25510 [Verrucomicrobia bacterium]|nr:hypothetical protein [Verrucomicrobiota bacterium]
MSGPIGAGVGDGRVLGSILHITEPVMEVDPQVLDVDVVIIVPVKAQRGRDQQSEVAGLDGVILGLLLTIPGFRRRVAGQGILQRLLGEGQPRS